MTLIGLLIAILIICVVIWAVRSLLAAFSVGEPLSTVVLVVVVLVCLFYFFGQLGVGDNILGRRIS